MFATLLLLLLLPFPVYQTDAEEAYRKQYQEYTQISEMTDPAAQAERYFAFIAEGFDDRLEPFVYQGLQGDLQALTAAGNFDKVFELADRWIGIRADDQRPVVLALEAAVAAGNPQQVVNYGEKFYAVQPAPQVALILAQNFSQLDDAAKVREYGQIAIDNFPIEQTWSITYELLRQDESAGRWPNASALARTLQSELSGAPEGVSASQWGEIRLYLQETVARNSYEGGRHAEAMQGFNVVLQMNPRSDKAYYYIGESLLATDAIAEAMNAFAKSDMIRGGYSARARDMLETIYRANHGGNLSGLDSVIEDARRELTR